MFAVSVYNGASFYIDVFSHQYIKSLELLKDNQAALKANLENKTNDGFMVLQQALASGKEKNAAAVIELLKNNQAALKETMRTPLLYFYSLIIR